MFKHFLILFLVAAFTIFQANAQTNTKADSRGYIVKVGDIAPDFTIKFTDNTPSIKLSDLRGQIVMLQFTASWCGVCKKEMPHIEKEIWQKFKDKGLKLYGIDLREDKKAVKKFAKSTKITYPLVLDNDGKIFSLYTSKNAGVTRNILIDKNGKIVFLTRLFDRKEFNELIKTIEKQLSL